MATSRKKSVIENTKPKHKTGSKEKLAARRPSSGNKVHGPERKGRAKGTPNKVTKEIRDALNECYDELGGVAGMVKWAKKSDTNRTEFYKLWIKQLPAQLRVAGENGRGLFDAFAQAVMKQGRQQLQNSENDPNDESSTS